MGEKPTAAAVLSIVGGVFILLFGIAVLALASIVGGIFGGLGAPVDPTAILVALALPSIVIGIVVIALGALMLMKPTTARILGVVVLVLSIVSFFFGGGFLLGGILALIGGILGIVFKPTMMQPMMAPPMAPPSMPPP
ncbi:MAG: DUF6114 domain-containing protein [Methanobacteriota archaeon]